MRWTVADVAKALGVSTPSLQFPLARLVGVSIDSRTVKPGELFFAIRGPRHDGHTYVASSLAAGALAAVVENSRLAEFPEGIRPKLLPVDDTTHSLQELSSKYLDAWRQFKSGRRLAAVTGSAGKTTTKEILAPLLASRRRVLKSEGNLNNEYGLPLTLFRLEDDHDAAVVELGMSHRGELARLAEIARPDVGVVTNVAPVHLEFFSSVDEIALAKRELIEGLGGDNPVAVLNADDERVSRFAEGFRGSVRYFGFSERAEFRADNIDDRGLDGSAFDFEGPDELGRLTLPLAGRHNILNALAALAAASEWGVGLADAKEVFPSLQPASMRGEILRFADGFTVINDCYNSNPVALARMVDLLCATPGYRRRILVTGEWREIGAESAKLHAEGGSYAAGKKAIDWIFGVEGHAKNFVEDAIAAGHPSDRAEFFPSSEDAARFLLSFISPGDLVLVKGSRGVHMEVIAKALEERFALAGNDREVVVKSGREGRS
ncbi:MAG TPA: UDP-N-acetylmuramoyl-tripeptide--D-alanyl-D-alanine ligase [Candidatus Acidoferrales bacterium]|nr:UDP-N-acetylmuramoyl-tripeptide--D-alanyl-D-alanine ligase [Candidatus Acidoferrales bacterium]